MTALVTPNQSQVLQCLRSFLLSVLPPGVEVVRGQDNRVPEPAGPDLVIMTPFRQGRLAFNVDSYVDAVFTGSISGSVMTISDVQYGAALQVGSVVFGVGVSPGTTITGFGTGTGGVGTYNVAPSQSVPSETLAAGTQQALIESEIVVQVDVHGPNSTDNAAVIRTMFFDEYACEQFSDVLQSLGFADTLCVQPLYCDEPVQRPFVNENDQVEYRWSVDAHIQANQTVVNIPQQFAAAFQVQLIEVDAAYPPSPVLT